MVIKNKYRDKNFESITNMLNILEPKEVEYCHLICPKGKQIETISGVAYRGKLFTQIGSYPQDELQRALRQSWQISKENKVFLLIKEESGLTLWSEEFNLKRLEDKATSSEEKSCIDLNKLVAQMRGMNGIEIKNRWYNLKSYPQCFVGSEAVEWLANYLHISPAEATKIGQLLVDKQLIHHVCDDHGFQNEYYFYRFYVDENVEKA